MTTDASPMSLDDVLDACDEAGIRISVDVGALKVTHASRLTDEMRLALKTHKQQIIRLYTMPLLDYVLTLFPGSKVLSDNGKPLRKQPVPDGGLFI